MAVVKQLMVRAGADFSGMRNGMKKAQESVNSFATKTGSMLKKLAVAFAAVFAVKKMIEFGKESKAAADEVATMETKLAVVMRQTMGASDDAIQSIKDLIAAQEAIGVVDGTAQTSAAQELATYLGEVQSMKKILPTLNDLIAQQYGMSASAEQATGMATMLGKVLDGQTGALKRYGFSFSEAEEKILKYGSEASRVALVADIVRASIGDMNAELGKTPQGQWKQIQYTFDAIKVQIGNGLTPVLMKLLPYIKAIANALLRAATAASAFVQALFGTKKEVVTATAQADAVDDIGDAYDKTGKKAKKASKSVSSFDQLNTVGGSGSGSEDDAGAGGYGGSGAGAWDLGTPVLDTGGLQTQMETTVANLKSSFSNAWETLKLGWKATVNTFGPTFAAAWGLIKPEIDKWKLTFQGIFKDIVALGAPLKDWIINSLVPAWQNGILVATGIISGLSETVRLVFQSIWKAVYPIIEMFVTEGLPLIMEFVTEMTNLLGSMFGVVKRIFDDLWRGVVDPVMQLISKIIKDALDIIFRWWDTWGKDIMAGLKKALDDIKKLWSNLWESFLKPFVGNMLKMLTQLWDKHLKGLVEEVGTFVGKLIKAVVDIFNKFILPLVNFLVEILGPTFSNIFSLIVDVIGTAIGIIADVAKGIIKALGGVVDFIAGVFTGDFKRAWNGIVKFFEGIADGIVGIFKGAVNLIIDALNFMIRMINNIKVDVPSWLGKIPGIPDDIKSIGFNIGTIPKLAVGTNYVASEGLAYLHEGEAVVPKKYNPAVGGSSDNGAVVAALDRVERAVSNLKQVRAVIGRDEVGKATGEYFRSEQRRTGRLPFPV